MPFDLITSDQFLRKTAKFLRKHPDLRSTFERTIQALEVDPFQPQLRLYALQSNLNGFHAISLTYQYRIVLTLNREEQTLTLLAIGSHDEVYGSSD